MLIGEGGAVGFDDGEGGGVAGGIAELVLLQVGDQVGGGFVLAGDVDEEGVGPAGGVGGRVVAGLAGEVLAIGGNLAGHLVGGEAKNAADAILPLGVLGSSELAGQEGAAGPGGAPEDAGGIGGGDHGGKILVPLGDADILGLVTLQEQIGGGADDAGGGRSGEEGNAGGTEAVDVAALLRPAAAADEVAFEDALKALHGVLRLGAPGGANLDDIHIHGHVVDHQIGFDLGLELVLAGLAGEEDDDGQAALVDDTVDDGLDDGFLILAERQLGGFAGEDEDAAEVGAEDGVGVGGGHGEL
ncbi:MAG: hypothetical protein P8Y03_21015 [Anaerolineales bacterium]